MRAIVRHEYGPPEVLRLEDVPAPEPRPDEVRIRVRAVAANRGDWELLTGQPRFIAVLAGLFVRVPRTVPHAGPRGRGRRPKFAILGYDIAGEIEAVGEQVSRFAPGDRVFGECGSAGFAGFAEYVCVRERGRIVPMPDGLSFEQAAAITEGGSIAWKAFRALAPVAAGQRILINGAGGGGGSFAIQAAVAAGAEVTGVDAPQKEELIRSLGAREFVDYTREDYTARGAHYDTILDLVAYRSVREAQRALAPDGTYLLAGGGAWPTFQAAVLAPILSRTGPGRVKFLMADESRECLEELGRQVEAGEIRVPIDRTFPLEETADALRLIGAGGALGKVIVVV